jgi:ribonucleoside-diphosphate reductase alpha chain
MFTLDPQVEAFNELAYDTPLVQTVLKKYYWPKSNEKKPDDIYKRVAKAISKAPCEDHPKEVEGVFYEMLRKRLFVPGGRINAGAGTDKRVTLMNCYVNRTIEDSMEGIGHSLMDLRLTMQQGGGMGTAFETLRPAGAMLTRTQSRASGILPFMDEYNASSRTIMSAGDRSGAMMGTISDTHPDLPAFIRAKAEGAYYTDDQGVKHPLPYHLRRWSQFNVSVLVSDAFMAAVEDDEEWLLHFHVDTFEARSDELKSKDFIDDDGKQQYVYSIWRARDLWDLITEYTYEYSDPGIIFIDRINDWNNLGYVETIRCTNPCGEQPLPPNGTCNLGAINLSQLVLDPFTPDARIDWDLLENVTKWGVRFLDNVIEVTGYPLEAQKQEEYNKRRIGLGILGLGTLLSSLQVRYGSLRSLQISEKIMRSICHAAYRASIQLAKERGSFPLFNAEQMLNQKDAFVTRLPLDILNGIMTDGLRNGVLLTIAPVGTGAIAFGGNCSSGLEPDFLHEAMRNVRKGTSDEFESYVEKSYTLRFLEFCTGEQHTTDNLPEYMMTAMDIPVTEHIQVQAALQKWVDASVSKTINVPTDISYEDFKDVYKLAYDSGCKGCTTYRPTADRMSILSSVNTDTNQASIEPVRRGDELEGTTYKIKWPSMSASMYVTINYMDDKPYEIFFASKDAKYQDWMTGLTLMISAIFRTNIDPSFIPNELKQVISTHDTAWNQGKFVGSLVARIGQVIEQDFIKHGIIKQIDQTGSYPSVGARLTPENKGQNINPQITGTVCPQCNAPTLRREEGCKKCSNCGYSAC